MKTIYHGSKDIIKVPEFGKGKSYNDYGRGFYCTENPDLALEWAVDLDRDGFANKYEIDDSGLSVLNINDEGYTILHWLEILLENRQFEVPSLLAAEGKEYIRKNFFVDYKSYDVIIGYRADDSYFSFAQDFLNGTISYRQLCSAMKLGDLGMQFVLKSSKAFDRIKYVDNAFASAEEWFSRKQNRDKSARRDYFNAERSKRQPGDIYITQIIDEEMRGDDSRLR